MQNAKWIIISIVINNVTLSSHMYPSNRLARVNMLQEVTMIWFDLLSLVKEVELMKTHHTDIQCQLQDPQEPIQYFRQLALGSHWTFGQLRPQTLSCYSHDNVQNPKFTLTGLPASDQRLNLSVLCQRHWDLSPLFRPRAQVIAQSFMIPLEQLNNMEWQY